MLLGFCTHPCGSRSLQEVLPKLAEWGYEAVELSAWPQHPCHPAKIKKTGTATVKELLEENDLQLSALAAHTQWAGVSEVVTQRALDYTKLCIDIAAELGAPIITTNSGAYPPDVDRHEIWERVLEGLTEAAEYAKSNEIVLAVEPHVGHIVFTWESARNIVQQVGSSHLKINFDAGHWHITGFDDEVALAQLASNVVHVHLKDHRLNQIPLADGRYDDEAEACALGQGSYDLARHVKNLQQHGYGGALSAELYLPDVDAGAEESARFMRGLLGRENS